MIRRIVIAAALMAAAFLSTACEPVYAQAPINNGTLLKQLYGLTAAPNCPLRSFTLTSTPARLLPNSAARISEDWFNPGVTDVYLWFDSTVSITQGIHLTAGGGFFGLNFRDDTVIPTYEVWGVASSGSVVLSEVDCSVQ